MRAWFSFALTLLSIACACPAGAQTQSASLEVNAKIAGALAWSEDYLSVAVNVALINKSGKDQTKIVLRPALYSMPDAAAKAAEIMRDGCSGKITADLEAHGQSVPRAGSKQTRFNLNTDVEELDPNTDAAPVLLVCAHYKSADQAHHAAILYRVLHKDPVKGLRPVDRVTGDIPPESLVLEELGRHAE